jgi:hypothetical protein
MIVQSQLLPSRYRTALSKPCPLPTDMADGCRFARNDHRLLLAVHLSRRSKHRRIQQESMTKMSCVRLFSQLDQISEIGRQAACSLH